MRESSPWFPVTPQGEYLQTTPFPGDGRKTVEEVKEDNRYDRDPARRRLKLRRMSLLVPHRKNHRNIGRLEDSLWNHFSRRFIVERTPLRGSRAAKECGETHERPLHYVRDLLPVCLRHDKPQKMFVRFLQPILRM